MRVIVRAAAPRLGLVRRRVLAPSSRLAGVPVSVSLVSGALWNARREPTRCEVARNEAILSRSVLAPAAREEVRWRVRVAVRLAELTAVMTPLAVTGWIVYALRRLGLGWTALEEAWWGLALRSVESAGPTFIKLCQWAATRNDLFPEAMTRRFSKLHENVAPHGLEHTAALLASAFGEGWRERLALAPASSEAACEILGSGCIAQVYRGSAIDAASGARREVAVKVVHPGVREAVALDMALLRWFGETLEALAPWLRYLGVVETLSNFEYLMEKQLDLRHEARNLERLAALFSDDDTVRVPRPVHIIEAGAPAVASRRLATKTYRRVTVLESAADDGAAWSSPDVLVEDYVEGEPIQSFVGSEASTASLLARRGATILLRMILQHNFVHGDLHPGNLLVDDSLRICLLDAGICIELPQRAHDNMVAMLRAMLECRGRDAGLLMLASDAAGRTRRERDCQNESDFVDGIAAMVERARSQSFFESIAEYYGAICALAIQNRVALDASFVSVALAVKIVEGIVTSLHPNFPILELALPMFLKAQFEHASADKLGRLSAYSRAILSRAPRNDPCSDDLLHAFDFWTQSSA